MSFWSFPTEAASFLGGHKSATHQASNLSSVPLLPLVERERGRTRRITKATRAALSKYTKWSVLTCRPIFGHLKNNFLPFFVSFICDVWRQTMQPIATSKFQIGLQMSAETWRDMKKLNRMKKTFRQSKFLPFFGFHLPHLPSYAKSGRSWWTQPPINCSTTCPEKRLPPPPRPTSALPTTPRGHRSLRRVSLAPSRVVVCRRACWRIAQDYAPTSRDPRLQKLAFGDERQHTPRKNWHWNMEKGHRGKKRFYSEAINPQTL